MNTKWYAFSFLITGLILIGCDESEDPADQNNNALLLSNIEEITNNATAGEWVITNFVDSGRNETSDFAGYGFSFNTDGSLVAVNGSTTVNGSWSLDIDDDTSPDNDNDDSDETQDEDCDTCTVDQLESVLTGCQDWFIEKLERDDDDLEDNYTGYRFDFAPDGKISVTVSGSVFDGTWSATGSGNNIQVVLSLPDLPEVEDTWTLHEIEQYQDETNVDMRIDGEDRLRFRNNCAQGDFSGGNSDGEIDFNIFFSSPADFAELTEDWDILSYTDTLIELIHVSGGNGGTDLLTFEKLP